MSARSYVNPVPRRRFGLRERLLVALVLGAMATVVVAVVGWISFQRVVGSQQAIIRDTLPAADALHEAVRGNARRVASNFGDTAANLRQACEAIEARLH